MAMLFDLDTERDNRSVGEWPESGDGSGDPVDQAFDLVTNHLRGLEPVAAIRATRRFKGRLSAVETAKVAQLAAETGNDRAAKKALNDGKTSKAAIDKAVNRGAAAAKNADLIDKVADGDLSEEHLDVIADTAAKTDGAAATDADFINDVAGVNPDQAKAVGDKFAADHADPDGLQSEHDRQRLNRRLAKYFSKNDRLHNLKLAGDAVSNENMWQAIKARANELYEADGGRDLATGKHPRTPDQRLFDAAYELICGATTTPTGTINKPRHCTDDGNSAKGSGKPQIFVGITLDKYLGLDPAAMAEQIGLGLIPDSVLADYLEHADILGVLYDKNCQPLWIARARRHASLMQRFALIARDKGCVLCGADHQQCQAHHLTPWNAPAKGETNLDELALLCGQCHRQLHANNFTLYQDTSGAWRTRPATPNETPPKRVDYPQRE